MKLEFETRFCMYEAVLQDELLDNDIRMLAPQSPFHPLFDDVRHDMLRDWQVE
jgi:hypothetical protein